MHVVNVADRKYTQVSSTKVAVLRIENISQDGADIVFNLAGTVTTLHYSGEIKTELRRERENLDENTCNCRLQLSILQIPIPIR